MGVPLAFQGKLKAYSPSFKFTFLPEQVAEYEDPVVDAVLLLEKRYDPALATVSKENFLVGQTNQGIRANCEAELTDKLHRRQFSQEQIIAIHALYTRGTQIVEHTKRSVKGILMDWIEQPFSLHNYDDPALLYSFGSSVVQGTALATSENVGNTFDECFELCEGASYLPTPPYSWLMKKNRTVHSTPPSDVQPKGRALLGLVLD